MATRFVGWFADPNTSYVDGIVAAGANAVAMGPYCRMTNWNDSDVGSMVGTQAQYTQAMQYARSKGLRVVLKPIIDCLNYSGDPYNSGFRTSIYPAGISAWMSSYWATCFAPYLAYVDAIAIHTELAAISAAYPSEFISLIREIRLGGFAGPITTSQDFNPLGARYWSSLDWIGGDAYPTIRTDSLSNAVVDWQAVADQAAVVNGQTGCGVYFGELCPNYGSSMTAQQISLVYGAFWEVFGPLDYWSGVSVWRWPQDGSTPPQAAMTTLVSGLRTDSSYTAPAANEAVSTMLQGPV